MAFTKIIIIIFPELFHVINKLQQRNFPIPLLVFDDMIVALSVVNVKFIYSFSGILTIKDAYFSVELQNTLNRSL